MREQVRKGTESHVSMTPEDFLVPLDCACTGMLTCECAKSLSKQNVFFFFEFLNQPEGCNTHVLLRVFCFAMRLQGSVILFQWSADTDMRFSS